MIDEGKPTESSQIDPAEAAPEQPAADPSAMSGEPMKSRAEESTAEDEVVAEQAISEEPSEDVIEEEAIAAMEASDAGEVSFEDGEEEEEESTGSGEPLELLDDAEIAPQADPSERRWYILKVQSNREDSIREALLRKIKIAALEDYFGDIIVPSEMVTEFKNGKKRVVRRKLYPGYIVVHMQLNDDTWFLVRETHGIGDFTGSGGKPSPMLDHEVSRIVQKQEEKTEEQPRLKISFNSGDRVKITEGTFENFEGDVETIDEANGRVTVMINIFGRSTPVELEYWQLESL